ncbi:MAG: hypothetical protein GXP09_02200 [Gammaproteobacteria bacterium]|nr:hypothetical protein [Gammaproteobacteria bacterium]
MIMLPLAVWSHWNIAWDITVIILVSLYMLAIFILMLRETSRALDLKPLLPFMVILSTLFIFSIDQAENLLWGWQMSAFLSLAGCFTMIFFLTRPESLPWHILLASIASAFAVYNYATSLALWPIGVVLILLHPANSTRKKIAYSAIFILLGAANTYHYYAAIMETKNAAANPISLNTIHFTLNFLGSGIARFSHNTVTIVGLAGLAGCVWLYFRLRAYNKNSLLAILPYAALAAYAVSCAILTAFGRAQYGVDQAGIARYITFSYPLWLALVIMISVYLGLAETKCARKPVIIALAIIVLFKMGNSAYIGGRFVKVSTKHNEIQQEVANKYPDISSALLLRIFPFEQQARHYLKVMYANRLNIFKAQPDEITGTTRHH